MEENHIGQKKDMEVVKSFDQNNFQTFLNANLLLSAVPDVIKKTNIFPRISLKSILLEQNDFPPALLVMLAKMECFEFGVILNPEEGSMEAQS